jgi:WD40 repeat protein
MASAPIEWIGHTMAVTSLSYSPDGQHVISSSADKTIRIWDVETGTAVGKPLEGHTETVWSIAYSPDGQCIASGSADKSIRIWDAVTGAAVGKPLTGHTEDVNPLLTLPMVSVSSLDPLTGPSESGMPRLVQ